MTIHLPNDLERSIQEAVSSGHFTSVDGAMAEAARLLLRAIGPGPKPSVTTAPDPLLGIWREAPDEIDEIVAEAMRRRREEPLRAFPDE